MELRISRTRWDKSGLNQRRKCRSKHTEVQPEQSVCLWVSREREIYIIYIWFRFGGQDFFGARSIFTNGTFLFRLVFLASILQVQGRVQGVCKQQKPFRTFELFSPNSEKIVNLKFAGNKFHQLRDFIVNVMCHIGSRIACKHKNFSTCVLYSGETKNRKTIC